VGERTVRSGSQGAAGRTIDFKANAEKSPEARSEPSPRLDIGKMAKKRKRDRGKRPITFSFLTLWAHTFKNKWIEKTLFRAKEVQRIEKKNKFAPIIYHS
jgi:hypothetical protein